MWTTKRYYLFRRDTRTNRDGDVMLCFGKWKKQNYWELTIGCRQYHFYTNKAEADKDCDLLNKMYGNTYAYYVFSGNLDMPDWF